MANTAGKTNAKGQLRPLAERLGPTQLKHREDRMNERTQFRQATAQAIGQTRHAIKLVYDRQTIITRRFVLLHAAELIGAVLYFWLS